MSNKKSTIRRKGLTLVEIIISMTLFALIIGGLASLFIATKGHTLRARSHIVVGELGRYFLDSLQRYVVQSDWEEASDDYVSSNPLHKRTNAAEDAIELDGINYTPRYTVDVPPGFPSDSPMRKVTLTISYPRYE